MMGLIGPTSPAAAGSSYLGPGDVSGSWAYFYGLRAYNAAYAASLGSAIDVVDQAGANSTTIHFTSAGVLNTSEISAWVALNSVTTIRISKFYDHTGNGIHLDVQATNSQRPTLVANSIGSFYGAVFSNTASQVLTSTNTVTQSQSLTMSVVVKATYNANTFGTILGHGASVAIIQGTAADFIDGYAGTGPPNTAVADASFHTFSYLFSGASSSVQVDAGAPATQNPGSGGITATAVNAGGNAFGAYGNMVFLQGGMKAGDMSASFNSLHTQNSTYWGY